MQYPDAIRLDLVEDLHGHAVADPYRWLEDATDEQTAAWAEAQDRLVAGWFERLPGRDAVRARLRALMPGMIGPPTVLGDRSFHLRRLPEEEHAVFVVREGDGSERVLIDPSALSPDGTVTLEATSLSKEGDLLAYQLAEGGDEVSTFRVMDVATGETVDGPIVMGRTGPVAWLPGGEELFYVRRLPDDQLPPGEEHFHRRVWRHRLGTDPAADEMVFGDGRDKGTYYGVSTSRDGRWLTVSASIGTAPRNDLYVADLSASPLELRVVQEGVDASTHGSVRHDDGLLYLVTDRDAPRYRLVVTDPATPTAEHWRDLLPESDAVLEDLALTEDAVVAVRRRDVVSEITVHDRVTGAPRAKVDLPGLGSASVSSRPEGGDDVWIGYTDHVTPYRVLHHSVATGELGVHALPPGAVDIPGVVARQVFYASADGTRVPMFVIAGEHVELDGSNPTILYGYGGFNVPMTPAYAASIAAWVEAGGVYAVANIRGGSEYGEEWHRAGMRDRKQRCFDDFIAAAEWLVAEGWTSPDHLGISGGSNGGLLVGAVLTQRPDLFASVVCSAPLLDMVRYERFGLGVTWNDEYGTADDPEELGWLLGYSPYHRVVEGTRYPAVLFTVFDNDSRVDPLHARKLCAALQWATSASPDERPVLYRREQQVGHGARSVSRTVDLGADTFVWHAERLGLTLPS